jgi:hypothetical protein
MKKTFTLFFALLFSGALFAQIGPSWWQMLPVDWQTNPYDRDTVTIAKVSDTFDEDFNSLDEMWGYVTGATFADRVTVIPINNFTAGAEQVKDAADLTAHGIALWNNNNLYFLFKVEDDEIHASDRIEMHPAPYVGPYNPGRPIYPAGFDAGANTTPDDPYDYDYWGRNIPGPEYVQMAMYGSWTEAGAYKSEWVLQSGSDLHPSASTYTLKGPDKDTLGDVVMGSIPESCAAVFETKTDGYYFLAIVPLTVFHGAYEGKKPNPTDWTEMSVALKVDDMDSDNQDGPDDNSDPDRSEAWGATGSNDAYWAIGFYGGVGLFGFQALGVDNIKVNPYKAYVSAGNLVIDRASELRNVSVFSVTGAQMLSVNNPSRTINLNNLSKGVYVVRLTDRSGNNFAQKIVK